MQLSFILSLIVGSALVVYGMMDGGNINNFISYSSMAITFGGTFATTAMSFPASDFKAIPTHFKMLLIKQKYDPKDYIAKIVEYAQDARRKGLLALEDKARQDDDEFLRNCVMLIVDAIEPSKAREMLENELGCLEERHVKSCQIYEKAATFAPAFGMIGTLVGLINMLMGLNVGDGDAAATLGTGMSVALITTFYGSVLANLILMPIANRLRAINAKEMLCKEIVVEGVLAIHEGTNPRHIEERLKAYVNSKKRESISNKNSDEPLNSFDKKKKGKKQ